MDGNGQGKERNRDVLNGWEEVPESFWREINNNEQKSHRVQRVGSQDGKRRKLLI